MAKCSECSKVCATLNALILHLKIKHKYDNLSVFKCREENCYRNFSNIKCYRIHFNKKHSINMSNVTDTISDCDKIFFNAILSEIPENDNNTNELNNPKDGFSTDDFIKKFKYIMKNEAIKFIAHLYSLSLLPKSHIQLIVDNFNTFFNSDLVPFLEKCVIDTLTKLAAPNHDIESICNLFSILKNPFADLSTEYLRLKSLEESKSFIKPIECTLGEKREKTKSSNTVLYKAVPVTAQFIPLRIVFTRLFENTNMLKVINDYKAVLQNETEAITNFTQSKYWSSISPADRENKITLPIFLYFDEYETGNPLGSHAGVHKLGAMYAHLPCLLPSMSSKLENYFLFFLFHSDDRKLFGKEIFRKVVDELQYLETTGINIKYLDKKLNIVFKLAMILGDNLGMHAILGFAESFNSNFPCRFCKVNKAQLQFLYKQDNEILRSVESYDDDCENKNVTDCGIREKCIFNSLNSFHAAQNYCVDAMHDLLEGVCNYDFQLILKHFVLEEKYFSLETLNFRIINFNYHMELDNKPPPIPQDFQKKTKLNMSSSEMLCLVRYFCFIIGDLVPKNNAVYKFFLLLRQIVDICVASSLSNDTINYLEWLISEHHFQYKQFFKATLKPKHHYLIHYPYIARLVGPFINFWSMRYESKHRESKMTAHVSCSRRNITKTLAFKHQLKLSFRLLRNDMLYSDFMNGSVEPISINEMKEFYPDVDFQTAEHSFFITKWVRINSILLKQSMIIEFHTVNLNKKFVAIKDIFLDTRGTIYTLCQQFKVLEYSEHFCAFKVDLTEVNLFIPYTDFVCSFPCITSRQPDGMFVATRNMF